MNRIISLTFVFVLAMIIASCGKGRQDPLGVDEGSGLDEGQLTRGGDGPNLVVSLSNQAGAGQDINEEVASAFIKAYAAISGAGRLPETARVTGDYSGYFIVNDSSTLNEAEKSLGYDFKVTFYDYSDAGYLFLGGALLYSNWQSDILVAGNVKFAGAYGGYLEYDNFLIPTDNNGNMISIFAPCETFLTVTRGGSFTFKSGDNILILNPYPVVVDIIERVTMHDSVILTYICDPDYSATAGNTSQLSEQMQMFQQ